METTVINATEYRELPLSQLNESKSNPRRDFDDRRLDQLESVEFLIATWHQSPRLYYPVGH